MGFPECKFLIPLSEDSVVGNGELQPGTRWEYFHEDLDTRYSNGWSLIEGATQKGRWEDPELGDFSIDDSRIYLIALDDEAVQDLKDYLSEVCHLFKQRCIYFTIRGEVKIIKAKEINK